MSIVAMESQCMKTIMIHLVDKIDFILWTGLNHNAMFYKTLICFYVSEVKPLCFSLSSQMFDHVERC